MLLQIKNVIKMIFNAPRRRDEKTGRRNKRM